MSMMYCEVCDKQIDTDFDAEHFDEHIEQGFSTSPSPQIGGEPAINDFDEINNGLKIEIDKRKIKKLIDEGVIEQNVWDIPIVFVCGCGQHQDVNNDICIKCGADIS